MQNPTDDSRSNSCCSFRIVVRSYSISSISLQNGKTKSWKTSPRNFDSCKMGLQSWMWRAEKLYWEIDKIDKKQVLEFFLCTAVCTESRHRQPKKDIWVSQQCCPRSGACSLEKINSSCGLAHCLEFHWKKYIATWCLLYTLFSSSFCTFRTA